MPATDASSREAPQGALADQDVGERIAHLEIDTAWIVDPSSGFEGAARLTIEDGVVTAIERTDGTGAEPDIVVAPGFMDMHVHLREAQSSESEDFGTALAAAAHGGFTWIAALPDLRTTVDRTEVVQRVRAAAAAAATPIEAALYGALTVGRDGKTIGPLSSLASAGVVGYSDDPNPAADSAILRAALTEAGALGLPVVVNADEPSFTAGAEANEGLPATILGLHGASPAAESGAVSRAVGVLRQVTAEAPSDVRPHLHVAHLSTAEALNTVRAAAADGLRVTCDVTPYHLALHDGWVGGDRRFSWDAAGTPWAGERGAAEPYDSSTRVDPPLRGPEDAIALLAGVEDGSIVAIATDHAPWRSIDKEVPFGDARPGMTGLETALGLLLEAVVAGRLSLRRVIRALTVGPWRVLDGGRRTLREPGIRTGELANLVIFDRADRWLVEPDSLRSRGHNTPLLGQTLPGRVLLTIAGGRIAYVDREIAPDED